MFKLITKIILKKRIEGAAVKVANNYWGDIGDGLEPDHENEGCEWKWLEVYGYAKEGIENFLGIR